MSFLIFLHHQRAEGEAQWSESEKTQFWPGWVSN